MTTNEDARELVETLREIAARNKADDSGKGGYLAGQCQGRAAAYTLAAKWVEELIQEEVMYIHYANCYYREYLDSTEEAAIQAEVERYRHVAFRPISSSATPDEDEFAAKFNAALIAAVGEAEAHRLVTEI